MLKALSRIRSLPQSVKGNELRAVGRNISSYNQTRDELLVQPRSGLSTEKGICSVMSLSLLARPSPLIPNNKAGALLLAKPPRSIAGIQAAIDGVFNSGIIDYNTSSSHYLCTSDLYTTDFIGDGPLNGDIIGYTSSSHYPCTSDLYTTDFIGDGPSNGDIGYDTFEIDSGTLNCSSILKKRKHKMNKHKYKKRRKRDKFKRRNLENIKERKHKAREKADERAKQAAG